MSLPKPERVDVGQWWHIRGAIMQVKPCDPDIGISSSVSRWVWCDYLGTGANPEPSEWMIDTLIDVISEVETGGSSRDEPHIGRYDRTNYRRVVFSVLANQCADLAHSRVIGVTYRLLRSLGKW